MPDPDLVIRTSGELRISNFLLWQSAYAELVFTDTLWPDFGPAEFRAAIEEYATPAPPVRRKIRLSAGDQPRLSRRSWRSSACRSCSALRLARRLVALRAARRRRRARRGARVRARWRGRCARSRPPSTPVRCSRSSAPSTGGVVWMLGGFLADVRDRLRAQRDRRHAGAGDRGGRLAPCSARRGSGSGSGICCCCASCASKPRLLAFTRPAHRLGRRHARLRGRTADRPAQAGAAASRPGRRGRGSSSARRRDLRRPSSPCTTPARLSRRLAGGRARRRSSSPPPSPATCSSRR